MARTQITRRNSAGVWDSSWLQSDFPAMPWQISGPSVDIDIFRYHCHWTTNDSSCQGQNYVPRYLWTLPYRDYSGHGHGRVRQVFAASSIDVSKTLLSSHSSPPPLFSFPSPFSLTSVHHPGVLCTPRAVYSSFKWMAPKTSFSFDHHCQPTQCLIRQSLSVPSFYLTWDCFTFSLWRDVYLVQFAATKSETEMC